MAYIVDVYTDAVYNNLRPLRANWEPSQPIKLGDYGLLAGESFQRLGAVGALGIAIGSTIDEDLRDQKIFSSASDMTVTFTAKGNASTNPGVNVDASVNISFASKNSVFFNAAGCGYSMIGDKAALGATIMQMYNQGTWRREWVVITDLIRAKATTIAVSNANDANIVLQADGSIPQINLADTSIGLTVKSATNVGYQVIAKDGLIPLLGMSKIQSSFLWWGKDFKPLTAEMMSNLSLTRTLQDSPNTSSEPASYLQFAQLA